MHVGVYMRPKKSKATYVNKRELLEASMSHIAVERNRRRQMNEHLKVLRSLTPCFYIKRVRGKSYVIIYLSCKFLYGLR